MDAPDILRELYRRYGDGDLDGVAALCHDDLTLVASECNGALRYTGRYEGVAAMLARQTEAFAEFHYERFEPLEVFGTGDRAAARVAITLAPRNGALKIEVELAHIVSVRDDKVAELHEFFDTDLVRRAMDG